MTKDKTQGNPFVSFPDTAADATAHAVTTGTVLEASSGTRYRVLDIKSGGMGTVYLCTVEGDDPNQRTNVALKTYHRSRIFDLVSQNAFRNEVTLWMRLGGVPFILPVLGLENIAGQYHIVMLAVPPGPDGEVSVADLLRLRRGLLPVKETFRYFFQMVFALAQAQKRVPGLVHGDIKPSNLLLLHGAAFLSDFGLAQLDVESQADRQKLLSTLAYQAPELWEPGVKSSTRTDIYASGVALYEMLAGRVPFSASTTEEWRRVHQHGERKPPDGFPDGAMVRELMQLALTCIAADPDRRPEDFAQLNRSTAAIGDKYDRELVAEILMFAATFSAVATEPQEHLFAKTRFRTMLELGQIPELLDNLDAVDDDSLDDELKMIKGTALSLAERPEESNRCFEEVLSHSPPDATRRHCLSEIALNLKRLRQFDDAEKLFQRLIVEAADEEYPKIATNLATVYLEWEKPKEAANLLQPLIREHPDVAHAWANLGQAQSKLGRHDEAIKSYQRALSLEPNLSQVRIHLAGELMDHYGRFDEALASLDLAYEQGFHSREWWVRTWIVNMVLGKLQDAHALLSSLDRPEVSQELKDAMVNEAVELLRGFVDENLEPQDESAGSQETSETPKISEGIDNQLRQRGFRQRFATWFKRLFTRKKAKRREVSTLSQSEDGFSLPFLNTKFYFPSHSVAIDFYGDLSNDNYLDELVESWRTAERMIINQIADATIRSSPIYFAQCPSCGQIVLTNRDEGESLNCRACGEKHPTSRIERSDLATILIRANERLGLELEELSSHAVCLVMWPHDDKQAVRLRDMCSGEKMTEVATESAAARLLAYLVSQRGFPIDPDTTSLAWQISISSGEASYSGKTPPSVDRLLRRLREEAGQFYSASFVIDLNDDDPMTLVVTGRADALEKRLRNTLQRQPDDAVTRQTLLGLLLSQNRIDEAMKEAEQALALHPFDPFTLKVVGMVEAKHGSTDKAIKHLQKSVEFDPTDVSARLHLANCYQQVGEEEKANEEVVKARAIGTPF